VIIIGEKINSSLSSVKTALDAYDKTAIQALAKKQYEAGASYIDVNAGTFIDDEPEMLEWIVNTVQEVLDVPFSLDSPNPKALESALKANKNGKPIINSLTGEKERYNAVMPLVVEYKTRIIALCMDDSGMPETAEDRVKIADSLIGRLTQKGVLLDDIFIDPMVRPIGTGSHYGTAALETIRSVKSSFPGVHIACGLSNISFGIPKRKLMNQVFLVAAMTAGMDGAIMDPLDKNLMSFLYAAETLLGLDDYCIKYMTKFREGFFD
jgi:cobalamin-dependent methionine synthase I